MRKLHRWPALVAGVLLIVLAVSGILLSVFPAIERVTSPRAQTGQSVAQLAALAQAAHPGLEQIRRAPSGKITVWWFAGNVPGSAVFDPVTGQDMGSADPNAVEQGLINFHRALFLNDQGRIVMALGAAAMLILTLSGAILVTRRVGGWGKWFARQKGPWAGRYHTEIARLAVPFLLLTAITALWMTAVNFDLVPNDEANPAFPSAVSTAAPMAAGLIPVLQTTLVADLRDLTFPADAQDVYTLTTARGMGFVDQSTGAMLSWAENGPWARIYDWIYLLHTGQGASLWGLMLGVIVMSVPFLAVTGTLAWAKGRRKVLRGTVGAAHAETVILVGSEGGTTWGFADTLARALQEAGQKVHLAALSSFAPETYRAAQRIVVMTATWGEGTAPGSARGAIEKLTAARPTVPLAILGFGDSSFPEFCAYAVDFDYAAQQGGWRDLLPPDHIDRQSASDFHRWGRDFGQAIGVTLDLNHQPSPPRALALTLLSRRDYGAAVQAPAAILRFALPRLGLWDRLMGRGFGRFQAGDLLGILPQGSAVPRYYSLASGKADRFIEIAMRKHPGGLCSGQLMDLQPGETIQAFVRANPDFHPARAKTPLILIGAGTGIGPLAGFVRGQGGRRAIHLWFGARHPDADLYYGQELAEWTKSGQLDGLSIAFSRHGPKTYVQDALRRDGEALRHLIAAGAKIMICGGRDMALGARTALAEVLAPLGLTTAGLKQDGRYAEDVY